jgi:hypothetical protein
MNHSLLLPEALNNLFNALAGLLAHIVVARSSHPGYRDSDQQI